MTMTMTQAEDLLRPGRMLIGDDWLAEGSAGRYVHINPSTGRPLPPVPIAGADEVDHAVASARSAYPGWRALPTNARRDALLRLAALISDHIDELATLVSLENGSPRRSSSSGPQMTVDNFTYYAGWVDKIGGDVIPTGPAPALDYTLMEPYGVIGVIIPWNAVMHNVGQVLGAALAAGNCVVLKAPELAPFAALRFGELALEAAIPPGVVNVLPGGAECGKAMVAHPGVDKVHFIGSGDTARHIMATAAQTLKPVTFELGGKSANIVFADADLQSAATYSTFLCMANAARAACCRPACSSKTTSTTRWWTWWSGSPGRSRSVTRSTRPRYSGPLSTPRPASGSSA